jgi:hypothetical protein
MRQQRAHKPFANKSAGPGHKINHLVQPEPGIARLLMHDPPWEFAMGPQARQVVTLYLRRCCSFDISQSEGVKNRHSGAG